MATTPTSFLSLPGEIRNMIYKFVMSDPAPEYPWISQYKQYEGRHPPSVCPWPLAPGCSLTPGLLRTCKTIHAEATPIFYGRATFDLTRHSPRQVTDFCRKIGSINSSHIKHVEVEFPECDFDAFAYSEGMTLLEWLLEVLAIIQNNCTGLTTITVNCGSADCMEHLFATEFTNVEDTALAVGLVYDRLRAFPSVQRVVLELTERPVCEETRSVMRSFDWTVKILTPLGEVYNEGWSLSHVQCWLSIYHGYQFYLAID